MALRTFFESRRHYFRGAADGCLVLMGNPSRIRRHVLQSWRVAILSRTFDSSTPKHAIAASRKGCWPPVQRTWACGGTRTSTNPHQKKSPRSLRSSHCRVAASERMPLLTNALAVFTEDEPTTVGDQSGSINGTALSPPPSASRQTLRD